MRTTKPLTDTDCRNLKHKPLGKGRIYDGAGLYLEAMPSGRKVWRFAYRFGGKENRSSFGEYPAVTLASARRKREDAKALLADGLDVNHAAARKKVIDAQVAASGTFAAVAELWYTAEIAPLSSSHKERVRRVLDRDILPYIGRSSLKDLTPRELLTVFHRIKERGAEEMARRARTNVGQVFRYAIRHALAETDPTLPLRGEKRLTPKRHFAAFTETADVARLMQAIYLYKGTPEVRAALKLSALLFQRPGEIRQMQWTELDFETGQWRYIVSKTKTPHIVPLSTQAIEVLRELEPLTGHGLGLRPEAPRYVFPSPRSRVRPMSDNAVRSALRNMGFTNDEMTAHGFRAMARSLLAESGWKTDAIERQLAHKASGPLGAAYDRAAFLNERKAMMQFWADHLDMLRLHKNVVPLRAA